MSIYWIIQFNLRFNRALFLKKKNNKFCFVNSSPILVCRLHKSRTAKVCSFSYSGTADCKLVEDYFQKYLLPNIPPNSTIVLDNARVHSKTKLQELCNKCQVNLLFLPFYSPDLNPIEKIWGNIKRYLQKYCNTNLDFYDNLFQAINKYIKQ